MVIKARDDSLRHDSIKLREIKSLAVSPPSTSSHGNEDNIVMPMPVRIITLPKCRPVFFRRQLIRVQSMGGTESISSRDAGMSHTLLQTSAMKKQSQDRPYSGQSWLRSIAQLSAEHLCPTINYALKELPQPQVVFATGFLMENPEPCTLST